MSKKCSILIESCSECYACSTERGTGVEYKDDILMKGEPRTAVCSITNKKDGFKSCPLPSYVKYDKEYRVLTMKVDSCPKCIFLHMPPGISILDFDGKYAIIRNYGHMKCTLKAIKSEPGGIVPGEIIEGENPYATWCPLENIEETEEM